MSKSPVELRIRSLVILGSLLMVLLTGIVAAASLSGLQRVAESNLVALHRRSEMADLRMLQLYVKNMYSYQSDYINTGDPVSLQGFLNTVLPLQEFRQKIRASIETEDARLNMNIISRQIDEYIALFTDEIVPARQREDDDALQVLTAQSQELIAQMDPFIQNMIAEYENRATEADQTAENTRTQTTLIVVGLSVVVGIIGLVSGILLARALSNSARQILLASEKVRQSEAALLESERFLNNIIENIPSIIFVKEAESLHYIKLNRAFELIFGVRDELLGKSDQEVWPHENIEAFRRADHEVLNSQKTVEVAEEIVTSTVLGERLFHTKKIPIFDENNVPRFILGISEDITERKRAEDEIHSLNAELEQRVLQRTRQLELSNRELESFAYSISHDLRTPLRAIEGYSHILLEEYSEGLDSQGQQYFERIRTNIKRMAQLIDDLLNMSRITRQQLEFKNVDLCLLGQESLKLLKETQPERDVEVHFPPSLMVYADPGLMRIVMDNLLGNAWKYTANCPKAVIDIGTFMEDGHPVYYMRDNGAGFDMAYAGNLFKPFHRLHKPEEYEGSGIGLAVVQRVIHRHGGRIWAVGAVDQGATFYFTLNTFVG
ncbi:MAG TPA: PAS domain-containing protein [Anaerolineaceae bacterium]|nr:PAS domain-containing protein [Anaerolineaceae bacterium]HPN54214.1 PAS domain-containing protein [Anaerolineaceae bacterium]